jgi:hypothetical protein
MRASDAVKVLIISVVLVYLYAGCGKTPTGMCTQTQAVTQNLCGEVWVESGCQVYDKLNLVVPDGAYVNPNPTYTNLPCTVTVQGGVASAGR